MDRIKSITFKIIISVCFLFNCQTSIAMSSGIEINNCTRFYMIPEGPIGKLTLLSRTTGGSTGGLWVQDQNGVNWFMKRDVHFSELQTSAEVISSKIYRFFQYTTPETYHLVIDGTHYSLSKDIGETTSWSDFSDMNTSAIRQMRVVAAYLKDWDRLGNPYNNRKSDNGNLVVLDFGGTLGSRAQGLHKPGTKFSDAIGVFEATTDIGIIYDLFRIQAGSNHPWKQINHSDAEKIIARFQQLNNSIIETIVDSAGYTKSTDRDFMVKALKMRRDGIIHNLLMHFTLER